MNNIAFLQNLLKQDDPTQLGRGVAFGQPTGTPSMTAPYEDTVTGPPPPTYSLPQIGGPEPAPFQAGVGLPQITNGVGTGSQDVGPALPYGEMSGTVPEDTPPPSLPSNLYGNLYGTPSTELPQIPAGPPEYSIPPSRNYVDNIPRSLESRLPTADYTKPVWERTDENGNLTGERTSNRKKMESWGKNVKTIVAEGKDRNKKWSIWEKLGAAGLGWLTGGLAGALKAGTDRNFFEKIRDQRIREDLLPQIAQRDAIALKKEQIAKTESDRIRGIAQTQGTLANQASQIERRAAQTKAAQAPKAVKYNGLWFNRNPVTGEESPLVDPLTGKQRTELNDIPIATKLSDGTPVFTTGDKQIDREIAESYRQAQFAMEKGKFDATTLNKFEGELDDWATKEQARVQKNNADTDTSVAMGNQAAELVTRADTIAQQIAEARHQPAPALATERTAQNTRLAALEKEERGYRDKAADLKTKADALGKAAADSKPIPKPTRPTGTFTAPNLQVGTYTEDAYRKAAIKKGITGKTLEDAVAQGKKDGIIRQ